MTNPINSSPNPNSRNKLKLEAVLKLVAAHPFKALLELPPEEVLDFFHSRTGEALLLGLSELKRRELDGLMSSSLKHVDVVDKFFETRGIGSVCDILIKLPEDVKNYLKAIREAK